MKLSFEGVRPNVFSQLPLKKRGARVTSARPILMSTPMVLALLREIEQEGTGKTQTRRVIKPQPEKKGNFWEYGGAGWSDGIKTIYPVIGHSLYYACPYGTIADVLWVRETFCVQGEEDYDPVNLIPHYRAGNANNDIFWKPPIYMPRWASRITLEITGIRVERLQDISEEDAYAEGIDTEGDAYLAAEHGKLGSASGPAPSVCAYADLLDSINGQGLWNTNPWVWVITFKPHLANVDDFLSRNTGGTVSPCNGMLS